MGALDELPKPTRGESATFGRLDAAQAIAMTAARAYVHGLASLLVDGRQKAVAASAEGIRDTEELVVPQLSTCSSFMTPVSSLRLRKPSGSSRKPGQRRATRTERPRIDVR